MLVFFRILAAVLFTLAGINHFLHPPMYVAIVPPPFPAKAALVAISGVAEIAGGLGLLVPRLRRAAGWGLIALLVAVFPANVYMAGWPERIPQVHIARWLLWARLPMQVGFIAWIWFAALRRRNVPGPSH